MAVRFEASQPYRSLTVWRVGPDGSSSTAAFDVESPTDADGNHDIGVIIDVGRPSPSG